MARFTTHIPLDLEGEIHDAVLKALEAGEGCVPGFFGTRPRENEEPVEYAITEALDYACVMEDFIALLKEPTAERAQALKEAIATKYASQVADGIREAREDVLREAA